MRIFLTGATGFLGSHVARVLAEQGAELRLLVRPTSNLKNLEGLNSGKRRPKPRRAICAIRLPWRRRWRAARLFFT